MTEKKMNYDDAVREIESILQTIEEGQLGVDELTEKVGRVTELLKICRDKLYRTESQVREILSDDGEPVS